MRQIMVIVRKDLREALRSGGFYFYVALALVIMAVVGVRALGGVIGGRIDALTEQGLAPAGVVSAIEPLMGTTLVMLSLQFMIIFCLFGNSHSLTMEKTKRSLESLLCTPLSLKQICLGKSLAIFLPCVVLGLLFAFATVAGADRFLLAPQIGQSVMPGAAPLVATLIAVPLIVFFLVTLLVALQLIITKIQWINGVLAGLLAAVIIALNYGLLGLGLAPSSIVFVCLSVAAALALVTVALFRLVTKERIVLSSKG